MQSSHDLGILNRSSVSLFRQSGLGRRLCRTSFMRNVIDGHRSRSSALIIRSAIGLLIVACSIAAAGFSRSDSSGSATGVPVLLELFTSEGCSSCPPADAFVERMDSQPLAGARLIVLSEHVDYWDHLGWKDPYSSHAFTERQAEYVRALHLQEPATPQIVLNGSSLLGGDPQQVQSMLVGARSSSRVPVKITAINIEQGSPAVVRLHIEADGKSLAHSADMMVASALDHAESDVLRGENGGKHLKYVAVAEEIKKIGKVEKGKDFSEDVQLKLKAGVDPTNLRIVAFVQESGVGKVLGADERRPEGVRAN